MEKRISFYYDILCCPGTGESLAGVEKLPGEEELFPSSLVTGPL